MRIKGFASLAAIIMGAQAAPALAAPSEGCSTEAVQAMAPPGTTVAMAGLGGCNRNAPNKLRRQARDAVRITAREREVIDALGQGLSNKEIAASLHIAVHTVKSHVHNVLEKLALHSRLEIAAFSHSKQRNPGADD